MPEPLRKGQGDCASETASSSCLAVQMGSCHWIQGRHPLLSLSEGFIANLSVQRQFFPTDEDESGAAKALMRLQDTYKLDPGMISRGEIPGNPPLHALPVLCASLWWLDEPETTLRSRRCSVPSGVDSFLYPCSAVL